MRNDKYVDVGDSTVIYRRNHNWYARIHLGKGQYLVRSLRTQCENQARIFVRDLILDTRFRLKHNMPVKGKTVSAAINAWLKHHTELVNIGRYSKNMLRHHQRVAKLFIEYVGNVSLDSITSNTLKGYVDWRYSYYQRHPERIRPTTRLIPQPKTLQFDINCFKQILKWAWEQGWAGKTPFPRYSFTPKFERVRPAFELNEWREFYRVLRQWASEDPTPSVYRSRQQFRNFVLLLANSGLRPGEGYNLQLRDIETFYDAKGKKLYRLIVRGKTGQRDVIPRAIASVYIERQLALRHGAAPSDYLFVNRQGEKLQSLGFAFNEVIARTSFKRSRDGRKFSIYSLRHTYSVFRLRYSSASVWDIARNMGTSIQMISRFYGKQATALSVAQRLQE